MKKVLVAFISISSSLFSTVVLAELNYDAISLSRGKVSRSGYPDMTAYIYRISKSLFDNVYIGMEYEKDVQPSGTTLALDVGFHAPLKDNTDLVFKGGLMNGSSELTGVSESSNGYQLSAGIRTELTPQFVGEFSCGYSNINSGSSTTSNKTTSLGLNVSMGYRITPKFELIAEIDSSTTRQAPIYSTRLVGIGAKINY